MCDVWRGLFVSQCEFVVVGDVVAGGYVVGDYAVQVVDNRGGRTKLVEQEVPFPPQQGNVG